MHRKIAQQMNCFSRSVSSKLFAAVALVAALFTSGQSLAQCADINENSVCDVDETGCTIELACNYDPLAVFADDASCDFVSCISLAAQTSTLAITTKQPRTTTVHAGILPSPMTAKAFVSTTSTKMAFVTNLKRLDVQILKHAISVPERHSTTEAAPTIAKVVLTLELAILTLLHKSTMEVVSLKAV